MPVTAKLSRDFYEKLGDSATNELVDWLNAVDGDYRSQLRDLNDLNFARFDAKVGQRFAEFEISVAQRFADAEVRMEQRFADAEVRMEQRFADAEGRMEQRFAALDVRLASFESRMMRWMFVFWTGTAVSMLGVAYAALHR